MATTRDKGYQYLYIISSLMLVSGAALGIVGHIIFDLIYLFGGVGYGLYFLLLPEVGRSIRRRRLVRMNVFAALLFVLSAASRMGLLDRYGSQLWVVALLLGLIFMIYANIILGRRE